MNRTEVIGFFLAEEGGSVSVYITITNMVVIYVRQNGGFSP